MFNLFNSESLWIGTSESLWIGTDMKRFNEIRTQLEREGIPYKYKTKDHLSQTMYPAEGTFNTPRLKSQIWCMGFRVFVRFASTNQNLARKYL